MDEVKNLTNNVNSGKDLRSWGGPFRVSCRIQKNRKRFLRYLAERYAMRNVRASLWRGTALHLLELTHFISPEMHEAAHRYGAMSRRFLEEVTHKSWQPDGGVFLSQYLYDAEREKKIEQEWRDTAELLEAESSKSLVDGLISACDLEALDHILRHERALLSVQKGLMRLHAYYDHERM